MIPGKTRSKMVMTERGLQLSQELLYLADEPPQFLEEAREKAAEERKRKSSMEEQVPRPIGGGGIVTMSSLYENSNGYLDRGTLKSARQDRSLCFLPHKPFFLPNYTVKDVVASYRQKQPPKQPGIYPPLISGSQSFRITTASTMQLRDIRPLLQKKFSSISEIPTSSQSFPSLPEYDQANRLKSVGTIIGSKGFLPSQAEITSELLPPSMNSKNMLSMSNIQSSPVKRTKTEVESARINVYHTRLEAKKVQYQQERESQDARLKKLAAARSNLSKDPVHVAAAFLHSLKQQDQNVDGLIYTVNFSKQRYKERLSEYQANKYGEQWSKLAIPQKKPHRLQTFQQNTGEEEEEEDHIQTMDTNLGSISQTSEHRLPVTYRKFLS